eukprot:m.220342 g.220342  ORF g.220342 m.220342 type:complete len:91 (-) comp17243_c0_seq23:63-335(-)
MRVLLSRWLAQPSEPRPGQTIDHVDVTQSPPATTTDTYLAAQYHGRWSSPVRSPQILVFTILSRAASQCASTIAVLLNDLLLSNQSLADF